MATRSAQQHTEDAHRIAVTTQIDDVAKALLDWLGPKLTAYLAGVADEKAPARWAAAKNHPRNDPEQRLRAAYQAIHIVMRGDSSYVARAWMIGINPKLDQAPADAIREGRFVDVLDAAKAFIAGG
jgi:hypothetical protein